MVNHDSLFRILGPSAEDIVAFHRQGYIAYPDVFTDEARTGLIDEVLAYEPVRDFLSMSDERHCRNDSHNCFTRPWNARKYWSDRLIDDPLVTNLLTSTIGPEYHFCHSALNVSVRGSRPIGFHQDHHHWFHENPVNLEEREKYYIQILYYPNGFTSGDKSLSVIPGSHRIPPDKDVTPDRMLAGDFNDQADCELREQTLEMPPGSMVYINARMFHAVAPKPLNSPQPYRIFAIDIFKETGPPHRYTQEIPSEWMERANPERRKLFQRQPYTETCWTEE